MPSLISASYLLPKVGEHLASFRYFADSVSDSENFERWGRAGKFADVVMSYEKSIGQGQESS